MAHLLDQALVQNNAVGLEAFINANLDSCSSPYDGRVLGSDWKKLLELGTTQEIGDFALTRYYDPKEDFGLGESWPDLEAWLPIPMRAALLGIAIGPAENLFDPGRQGSYIQSPALVRESASVLGSLDVPVLQAFQRQLVRVAASGQGIYVTF
ncbi:MAG: hypothetical protein KDC71_07755 [Acidobacteria bacterium]|nr:hypothetical protein [Acidobacteriota bacterium]